MDDDTLATLEHENMVATMSQIADWFDGALVRHERGVTIVSAGLPVFLFNQVLVSGPDASDDGLREAVGRDPRTHGPFVVNLRVGADDRFLPAVAGLGLVPISETPWMPGMAVWPISSAGTTRRRRAIEIRRATDSAGIADHITAAAEGFGMPAEWLDGLRGRGLDDGAGRFYVGYADGVPVTSGMGQLTGSTIGIYNIATVPAARRGYGAAMTSESSTTRSPMGRRRDPPGERHGQADVRAARLPEGRRLRRLRGPVDPGGC